MKLKLAIACIGFAAALTILLLRGRDAGSVRTKLLLAEISTSTTGIVSDINAYIPSHSVGGIRKISGPTNHPNPGSLERASIMDGDHLLSIGVPNFRIAYRELTISGINEERAKALLRPVLVHLSSVASCNRFLISRDKEEIDQLENIGQDDSRSLDDREITLKLLAMTYRQFRETWNARRQQRLEDFSRFIADLGIDHPEALLRELLLIQPSFPPPDPQPQ